MSFRFTLPICPTRKCSVSERTESPRDNCASRLGRAPNPVLFTHAFAGRLSAMSETLPTPCGRRLTGEHLPDTRLTDEYLRHKAATYFAG
jgi:hypothetical protein